MKNWNIIKIKNGGIACPFCGLISHNGVLASPNSPQGQRPTPGQPCICEACGEIALIGDDVKSLRAPSEDEKLKLQQHPAWREILNRAIAIKLAQHKLN